MTNKLNDKPFAAAQFTPTEFSTAEDKAKFANDLAAFVASGYKRTKFTKGLYQRLSNCFGHIAHFNIHGFYDEWFTKPEDHQRWVRNALDWGCYGEPEYTFCDVEQAFQKWLRGRMN